MHRSQNAPMTTHYDTQKKPRDLHLDHQTRTRLPTLYESTRTGQENAEADLKLNYPILGEFCNYTKDRPLGINMHYLLSLTGAKPCLSRT